MAGSFDGRMPTRGVEQAIVALKKGAHLLKFGKRGKPKFCPFRLSSDEKTLVWYSKDREKHLSLNSVSTVVLGQKTICRDRDQAECWFLGLTALTSSPYSPLPLAGSKSGRQINSCAISPRSYLQRKCRLSAALDTPRHTQVYPSYGSPKIQKKIFGGNLDSSEALFYPRHPTSCDIDSYIEKLNPKIATPVKHGLKDIMVANRRAQNITHTPKLKTFEGPRVACRLDSLKDVFLWGSVLGSMLGSEDIPKSLPRLVGSAKMLDVQSIACGENHAAIITKQGEVYTWGSYSSGRLDQKVNVNASCPKMVESLASVHVKAVAFGSKHTCAITVSGELFEWGEGAHSLGLMNDWYGRNQWFPHKFLGPMDNISVSKIACGEWHTAIITSSGQLFTYGDGTFGVLGHGDTQGVARPKEVESLKGSRVKSVACGPWHTAAIVEVMSSFKGNAPSGKLFTWGDADRGKLGHADRKMKLLPTCVDSLTAYDLIQVSCGTAVTVVLTVTGMVFTIGSSRHGQLGNPKADGESICSVEGPLKTEFVREISSGSSHVAVLTMSGKVFTWGKGAEGQLGLGDYSNRSSPTLVEALEGRDVESVVCGFNFTAAICLHKTMSMKDQSVCSSCQMVFGFTRKEHNCYNCGSMFCSSCTSNKITMAALAPDTNRRYRVCDACFYQLQKVVDSSKDKSRLKISKGEMFKLELKAYTPKLSRLFKEANFFAEKMASVQGTNQRNEEPATAVQTKTERWGQVECPALFISAQDSFQTQPVSNSEGCAISFSQRMHDSAVLKSGVSLRFTDAQREEIEMMQTELQGQVKQLHSQVAVLTEQCQQKSVMVQLYKQKLDDTWLVVRDEAARCKAAKDIIKVLTDQCNALSEKLSIGQLSENSKITPNSIPMQPTKIELQGNTGRNLVTRKLGQLNNTQNHGSSIQTEKECVPLSNAVVPEDVPFSQQNGARKFSSDGYTTEAPLAAPPTDSVTEQIEHGVYVTFSTSSCGKKDIKRIRFSRKHFGEKEAQHWWEHNKTRVYDNYKVEQMATPSIKAKHPMGRADQLTLDVQARFQIDEIMDVGSRL
ncbi:Os04g0583700 [Oryza sativa Japonica Group]|uniref:Os04g0583700 protein n=1 Tax=Oryza sativa subsp. japonica TaxID=39947 RepID=Q0JAQ8_ORYSJ|nr:Os04g0583700 [Oryza sativa Japonica Group]|eukprot:NP_001053665.2 Os04g0583700 [Oryza sativa Japonica Group]